MAGYLLIESRDPRESAGVAQDWRLARDLARAGHAVTVCLVQNGAFQARAGGGADGLRGLLGHGISVLGDEFSLRERGIADVIDGVRVASLDAVVDGLVRGDRILWL
jgi:hypothetical protein